MRPIAAWVFAGFLSTLAFAGEAVTESGLTAAQIVEKNVAARGGLEAWRKIQTMVWVGHVETANAAMSGMPFVLELKRPDKTRFEIRAQNQVSARIFDGSHGWKLHPTGNGRPGVQPYTSEELKLARDGQVIDGPLIDYEAKGNAVALDGVDEVEGRKAYRLNVKIPSGVGHHVWVDAETFLDIKSDRVSHNAFGQSGTVVMYYRNYRTIEGIQIPSMIETGGDTTKATDKMVIDKIALNPPLEDRTFAKPSVPGQRHVVSVGADPVPMTRRAAPQIPSLPPRLSRPPPEAAPGSVGGQ